MPEISLPKTRKRFLIGFVTLLILGEMVGFLVAWNASGKKAWLQVKDPAGAVLYETRGDTLTRFDKYYFEQNFGPLAAYHTELVTREVPFPLTGWLFAAIGVPVGLVLFFAFSVKVWRSLFSDGKKEKADTEPQEAKTEDAAFDSMLDRMSRTNVFVIGGGVFAAVLALWAVPVLVSRTATTGLSLVMQYKWVFAILFSGVLSVLFWFLYLRYRLASQAMATRADLERMRLQIAHEERTLGLLPGPDSEGIPEGLIEVESDGSPV